jgi:hypothetical protein
MLGFRHRVRQGDEATVDPNHGNGAEPQFSLGVPARVNPLSATLKADSQASDLRQEVLRQWLFERFELCAEAPGAIDAATQRRKGGPYPFNLNTGAAPHALDALMSLLQPDCTKTPMGVLAQAHLSPQVFNLILRRSLLAGSMPGGVSESLEC